MHLHDIFMTAPPTASQIPGLKQITSKAIISCLRQARRLATERYRGTASRWTTSVLSRTYLMESCTVENRSLFQSRWTFQNISINVMSPIVFWNTIVWVVVVSWYRQGFTMRVNGALNVQIYRDEILQQHVGPLINVTGGIFQCQATHYVSLLRFSTAKQRSCLTMTSKTGRFIPTEHLWDILDRRVRQRNPTPLSQINI